MSAGQLSPFGTIATFLSNNAQLRFDDYETDMIARIADEVRLSDESSVAMYG